MDQEQDRHVTVALDRPPALAPDLHLRPYQQEAVDAVLGAWGANVYRPAIVHATGLGKDLADDTEIPVPGGFARMGDLRVGDRVFSVDGVPTRITGVYPQGEQQMYRVEFTDGAVIYAGAGHLWTVSNHNMRPTTMTTAEIMSRDRYKSHIGWLWRVPVLEAVQHPATDLPVDPYLVGSLIANGYIPHGRPIQLTTPDVDVIAELRRRGVEVRDATRETSTCSQWSFPGISAKVRSVIGTHLSADKRIPREYLASAPSQRLDLLRGLMDGDGSSRSGGRRSVNFSTTSEGLAEDITELVWSLGGSASVSKYDRTPEGKPVEFQVHILMPVDTSPFLTERKQGRDHPRRQFRPKRAIISITPAHRAASTCIEVEHPSRLFAAGRRYVMTHNTVTLSAIVAEAVERGLRVVIVAHRHELLEQIVGTLHRMLPGVIVGVVAAQRREYSAPVVVASLPTIAKGNHVDKLLPRQVVIQDECFVAGTLVDGRPIEAIRPGDFVTAWNETASCPVPRRVTRVMRSIPSSLVRVTFSDGQSFVCTPGHPFLTDQGWKDAGSLFRGAGVIQLHHEKANRVPGVGALPLVLESGPVVHQVEAGHVGAVRPGVLHTRVQSSVFGTDQLDPCSRDEPTPRIGANGPEQSDASARGACQGIGITQGVRTLPEEQGREREADHRTAAKVVGAVGVADRDSDTSAGRGAPPVLLGGHREYRGKGDRRGGRAVASISDTEGSGPTTGRSVVSLRVVDVEVLEPGSDGRYGGLCPDGFVYNLEVATDHTYTVGDGVVVHNCHHAMAPTYIRALERLGVGPEGPAFYCGVTATLRREDGESMAELVDEVVHERDLKWAIDNGYLVPPTGLTVQIPGLRLDKVRTIAGDFSQSALDEAIAAAADAIVHAVTAHAADRRMIVFVPGVAAAAEVAEALTEAGFTAEAVTGAMPMDERRPVYERFRRGETQALVTVQVLTEGADFPMCDCAVIARPTKSRTLYAQIVGRAVRSYTNPLTGEKKTDALVLDITGVARVHGLLNLTDLYGAAKRRKVEVDEDGNVGDAEDMTDADLEDEGAGAAPPPKPQRHGPQEFERIDLFTGAVESEYVWLTTPSGIPFLSSTERVVFLWEAPMAAPDGSPGWWIGTRSLVSPSNGPAGWVFDLDTPPATVGSEMFLSTVSSDWSTHDWRIEAVPPGDPLEAMPVALPSNEAMELAEKLADTLTNTPIRRSAGWRSKSAPSDAQIGLARSLRIPEPELMTRARLSDEITTVKVARLIDPNGARR